ncbi:Uncharacterized protein SCF082_LOCUS30427 [Durusdinium trenchii]|uniref:Uncharacterized protein n=1 Tax=Durusdinium trenchii TaxID=1381693 RepID=A0ABP0MYI0_9DINO
MDPAPPPEQGPPSAPNVWSDPRLAKGTLAKLWESESSLRARMMDQDFPYLTRWVTNPKTKNVAIGIPSVKAMGLNVTALEKLAEWYCPVQPIAKCVNINVMRREDPNLENFFAILERHWAESGPIANDGYDDACDSDPDDEDTDPVVPESTSMDMVDTVPMDTQDMTAAESVVENANAAKSCEAVPMEPKDTYIPAAPVEETSSQLLKAGPLKTQDVLEAHAEENEKEKLLKARTLILGESPSGKGFGLSGGPPAGDAGPASGEVAQHAGQKEETVDGFGGEEQFEPPRVSDSEQAQGGEKESKNLEKGKIEKGEHKDPEKPEETVVIEEKVKNKELEHKGPEKPEETVPSGSAASKRSEELKNEDGSDSSGGGPALPTETFVSEVEVLRSEMESTELTVEGEFATEADMIEWGFSEQRIEAIKKHCRTQPSKLMKDIYQNITLYYVERSYKASMKPLVGTQRYVQAVAVKSSAFSSRQTPTLALVLWFFSNIPIRPQSVRKRSSIEINHRARMDVQGGLQDLELKPGCVLGEGVEEGQVTVVTVGSVVVAPYMTSSHFSCMSWR